MTKYPLDRNCIEIGCVFTFCIVHIQRGYVFNANIHFINSRTPLIDIFCRYTHFASVQMLQLLPLKIAMGRLGFGRLQRSSSFRLLFLMSQTVSLAISSFSTRCLEELTRSALFGWSILRELRAHWQIPLREHWAEAFAHAWQVTPRICRGGVGSDIPPPTQSL